MYVSLVFNLIFEEVVIFFGKKFFLFRIGFIILYYGVILLVNRK